MTTATITREPITRPNALSEQETLRQNLARFVNRLTNNGADIAQFMYDVVQGEYPDAKHHHRQQAARDLAVMGGQMAPRQPRIVSPRRPPRRHAQTQNPQSNTQTNHQQTHRRIHTRKNRPTAATSQPNTTTSYSLARYSKAPTPTSSNTKKPPGSARTTR